MDKAAFKESVIEIVRRIDSDTGFKLVQADFPLMSILKRTLSA